ncbi:transcriptional regulator, LysR family [Limimonas halophila]|uniref:Transcriptional regulator, LysR family n=1 Tax=Limimonas halophila TaxID=1082479 RepID=A0A1G7TDU7_9PROT|nr:LysR substrate-binding domain-containing protein [Limimonas halophila]SDG33478.1 transcriptional regulator, LysR family [Limimonas halophila]
MELPPFAALRAFEAAARLESFRAAATELRLSESAISHQVKKLERHLGVTLFLRRDRRLTVTAAGRQYQAELGEAIAGMRAATRRVTARATGRLTLSIPPSFAGRWLVPRLPAFQTEHPGIALHLETSARVTDFSRDAVDAAVRMAPDVDAHLHADRLWPETLAPVAGPSLRERFPEPADAAAIARGPLLANSLHPGEWAWWARTHGLDPAALPVPTALDSSESVLRASTAGMGVGLGRRPLVDDGLADGSLIRLGEAIATGAVYWFVAPPHTVTSPAVDAFRRWLLRQVRAGG